MSITREHWYESASNGKFTFIDGKFTAVATLSDKQKAKIAKRIVRMRAAIEAYPPQLREQIKAFHREATSKIATQDRQKNMLGGPYRQLYNEVARMGNVRQLLNIRKTPSREELIRFISRQWQFDNRIIEASWQKVQPLLPRKLTPQQLEETVLAIIRKHIATITPAIISIDNQQRNNTRVVVGVAKFKPIIDNMVEELTPIADANPLFGEGDNKGPFWMLVPHIIENEYLVSNKPEEILAAVNPTKRYIYQESRVLYIGKFRMPFSHPATFKFKYIPEETKYRLVDKGDTVIKYEDGREYPPIYPFSIDGNYNSEFVYDEANNDPKKKIYELFVYSDVKFVVVGKPLYYYAPEGINQFWENLRFAKNAPGTLNCVIDAVSRALPKKEDGEAFKARYNHMRHEEDKPVYVDVKFMKEIGGQRLNGITFRLYTQFGYAINKPSIEIGRKSGTVVSLFITEDHADILPSRECGEIEYINADTEPNAEKFIQDEVAHNTAMFDKTKTNEEQQLERHKFGYVYNRHTQHYSYGWREYKDNRVLLRKYLRPSTVTGRPKDDDDFSFFKCISPESVFAKYYNKFNNFSRTPMHIQAIVRQAAVPISQFNFAPDAQESIEIDQNASYASYESNPYYQGFPNGYWRHVGAAPRPEDIEHIAFVEVRNCQPKDTDEARLMFINCRALIPDMKVIAGPLYKFLSQYFDFDISSTIYAKHEDAKLVSLLDEVRERLQLNEGQIKILRNMCLGRLVGGGVKSNQMALTFTVRNREYLELLMGEVEANGGTHMLKMEDNLFKLSVRVPTEERSNYVHQYAYVLAYSKISTLKQLLALQLAGAEPTSVHVDAIRIPKAKFDNLNLLKLGIYDRRTRYVYGEWKYSRLDARQIKTFANELPTMVFNEHRPTLVNPIPLTPLTVIAGPAGVCKTKNIIDTAPATALYVTPTKELRKKMRIDLLNFRRFKRTEANRYAVTYQLITYHYKYFMYWRQAMKNIATAGETAKVMVRRRVNGREKDVLVDYATLDIAERWKNYRFFKRRYVDIIRNVSEIYIDEFTKCGLSDMLLLREIALDRRIYLTLVGDYEQTINEIESIEDRREAAQRAGLVGCINPAFGVNRQNLEAMGFIMYHDPRSARSPLNDKHHRHSYEYGNFLDSLRGHSYAEQVKLAVESGLFRVVTEHTYHGDEIMFAGTWARIAAYNAKLPKDAWIKVRDIKDRSVTIAKISDPCVWSTKSRMDEAAPAGKKYIAYAAGTVDACQGETLTTPVVLDVKSLTKHGAFYTAITRTTVPELVTLLV